MEGAAQDEGAIGWVLLYFETVPDNGFKRQTHLLFPVNQPGPSNHLQA
jgi:hypothetical protein